MSGLSVREFLQRIRGNPFLRLSQAAIRERAYFRWLQTPELGEQEHWFAAEDVETDLRAVEQLVRAVDKSQPSLAERQFDVDYVPIASWAFPPNSPERPITLGSTEPQRCSICRKKAPEVTFTKEAHVVPESLGNRWLTTRDECDACNKRFGEDYEDDLGKLTLAVRALSGTRAKKKTAKLKTGLFSSLGGGDRLGPVEIVVHPLDPTVSVNLAEDGSLSLGASLQSFRPARAAKALARVAWQSLPPSRRAAHEPLRAWLNGTTVGSGVMYSAHVPGLGGLTVGLWERVSDDPVLPNLVVAVGFNHTVLLWAAPDWDTRRHQGITFPLLPRPIGGASIGITRYQSTDDKRVTKGRASFELGYERVVLRWTRDPLPVVVEVEVPAGVVKIATFLTTPQPPDDLKGKVIAHDVSGGELVGNLQIAIPLGGGEPQARFVLDSRVPGDPDKTAVLVGAINQGTGFRVITVEGSRPVVDVEGTGKSGAFDASAIEALVYTASRLAEINQALGTDVVFPSEINDADVRVAEVLAEGIRRGSFTQGPCIVPIPTHADGARELISLLGAGPATFEAPAVTPFAFAGTGIDVGPTQLVFKDAELVESPEALMQRISAWPVGGVAPVPVRCKQFQLVFLKFDAKEDGESECEHV